MRTAMSRLLPVLRVPLSNWNLNDGRIDRRLDGRPGPSAHIQSESQVASWAYSSFNQGLMVSQQMSHRWFVTYASTASQLRETIQPPYFLT